MFEKNSQIKNNNVIFKIHANYKDRLLDLFSHQNKTFKLYVNYTIDDDQNYSVEWCTPLPILKDLEDFSPRKKFTGIFLPEEMPDGKALIRLFNNRFYLKGEEEENVLNLHKNLA